jgi:hypothetical protein
MLSCLDNGNGSNNGNHGLFFILYFVVMFLALFDLSFVAIGDKKSGSYFLGFRIRNLVIGCNIIKVA